MKRVLCATLCMLTLFMGSGCKKEEAIEPLVGWPVTVSGITLDVPPAAAVTLSPGLTETVFSLGYGGRLVGVSDACGLPLAAVELPACGSPLYPDVSRILSLAPNLVISPAPLPKQAQDAFAQAGIAVLIVAYSENLDGIFNNYGVIARAFEGEITGELREEQMRLYGESMVLSAIDSVKKSQTQGENKTGIIWLRYMPLTMATGDTLPGEWLARMGFDNQAGPYTGWTYPLEKEPDLNPDIILYDVPVLPEQITAHEYYRRTNAVRDNRLYAADCAPYDRQSPHMFYHLWDSMRNVFPKGFGEPPKIPVTTMPETPPPPEPTRWERIVRTINRLLY